MLPRGSIIHRLPELVQQVRKCCLLLMIMNQTKLELLEFLENINFKEVLDYFIVACESFLAVTTYYVQIISSSDRAFVLWCVVKN